MKTMKNRAMLIDVTKCIGCEQCVDACKKEHNLPAERKWPWMKSIRDLSSARWTTIRRVQSAKGDRYLKRQCRHCLEPACVEACIVGALQKTDDGPVVYDRSICIGCRYCMIVCPWEIPRYSWEDAIPYIQKCDMCSERFNTSAKPPACVEVCPTKAIIFGERSELLAEAYGRLAAQPSVYIQHVWGEQEVGGTSVLYISDVDLNLSDLPKPIVDTQPMPQRTFKILHQMPLVFVGMAVAMGGIHFVVKRRQDLMNTPQEKHDDGISPQSEMTGDENDEIQSPESAEGPEKNRGKES